MSIWSHIKLQDIPENFRLTLGEGNTPLSNSLLAGRDVTFKHEEKNPTGSFKDRSLAYQMSYYYAQGKRNFVISSSGNAAISAAALAKIYDLQLTVFVAEKTNKLKLAILKNYEGSNIKLITGKKPKSDAIKHSNETGAINLRGSTDDKALPGFKTIAYEIIEHFPAVDAVFVACSSGTSATALAYGFDDLKRNDIQLHICQTAHIHPIAKDLDQDFNIEEDSLADAIVDRVAKRKHKLLELIKQSNGAGWVIGDKQLKDAHRSVSQIKNLHHLSFNSLLALAGYLKARQNGYNLNNPVIILSGT